MVFFCYQGLGISVGFLFFRKGGVCFSGFLRFHQPLTAGDHCLGFKCFVRDQCKPVSILEPQQLNVSSERCEREWCETWKKKMDLCLKNMAVFWSFLVKSHRWPRLHYLPWIGYTTDCKNLPGMDHSKHSQLGFSHWGFPHYRWGCWAPCLGKGTKNRHKTTGQEWQGDHGTWADAGDLQFGWWRETFHHEPSGVWVHRNRLELIS